MRPANHTCVESYRKSFFSSLLGDQIWPIRWPSLSADIMSQTCLVADIFTLKGYYDESPHDLKTFAPAAVE